MDVIPVLDLRGGIVVHARKGERASYLPLHSELVTGCRPEAVLPALLAAVATATGKPAPAVYVADLDGIVDRHPQWPLLEVLRAASPVPLWVDAGLGSAAAAMDVVRRGMVPVVGSESLQHTNALVEIAQVLSRDTWLLSLDADGTSARDPGGSLLRSELWPARVIAMDLTRVGSTAGVPSPWLLRCMAAAPDRHWIAAGGVRHSDDLIALTHSGAQAALVATALHTRTLSPTATKNPP